MGDKKSAKRPKYGITDTMPENLRRLSSEMGNRQ